jgi:predicted O-methyltransferase YrrM
MRSEDAVSWFADESIDILHIDGNHATEAVLKDVRLFLPKVKRGGYIWFDDADWPSTLPAQKLLLIQCFVIKERSEGNSCLLFQKR